MNLDKHKFLNHDLNTIKWFIHCPLSCVLFEYLFIFLQLCILFRWRWDCWSWVMSLRGNNNNFYSFSFPLDFLTWKCNSTGHRLWFLCFWISCWESKFLANLVVAVNLLFLLYFSFLTDVTDGRHDHQHPNLFHALHYQCIIISRSRFTLEIQTRSWVLFNLNRL